VRFEKKQKRKMNGLLLGLKKCSKIFHALVEEKKSRCFQIKFPAQKSNLFLLFFTTRFEGFEAKE